MKLAALQQYGLIYLATPYTKYQGGIEVAFQAACIFAAALLRHGLKVYSPIAHTHPIAVHGGIDPLDLAIWLPFDGAMMERSEALLVAKLPGWEQSVGIAHEIDWFRDNAKPVWFIEPGSFELSREWPQ